MSISAITTNNLKSKLYGILGREVLDDELSSWINECFLWILNSPYRFTCFEKTYTITSTGAKAYSFATAFPGINVFDINGITKVYSLTNVTDTEILIPLHDRNDFLRQSVTGTTPIYFNIWDDKIWITPDNIGTCYVVDYYGLVTSDTLDYTAIYNQLSSVIIPKTIAIALRDNAKIELAMQYDAYADKELSKARSANISKREYYGSTIGKQVQ